MIPLPEVAGCFRKGVLAALDSSKPVFDSLKKLDNGEIREITGISFEIYPWHDYLALSMRDYDNTHNDLRYSPANWKYFEFVRSDQCNITAFVEAGDSMRSFYNTKQQNGFSLQDAAHLLFECGAAALIDAAVAKKLNSYGIKAPELSDEMCHSFEYMVFDSDKTFSFNYCERLCADRRSMKLRS